MKIGILTQPLNANYGGVLQNYALQKILQRYGHNPLTINKMRVRKETLIKKFGKFVIRLLHSRYEHSYLTWKTRDKLVANIHSFISENITITPRIFTKEKFLKVIEQENCDAYIVGSDQCWRPIYSPDILNYFLDFCRDSKVRKIAYATSFGTDKWEFSPILTDSARNLIKNFDAISVREYSALNLCKSHLNADAEWVLDPTMLLDADDYSIFIRDKSKIGVTEYFLEDTELSKLLEKNILDKLKIDRVVKNHQSTMLKRFDSLKNYQAISVEEWLSNIANASYVITDSFHGVVFSIIFNTPFMVSLNTIRGNTRIESLLKDFNLEECIFNPDKDFKMPVFDESS